jgi:alkanesulfonate monooxygenase SsuD/methylene tetrahydromethanopterin reductase-like flavin-dependent oxidoreductase (luciferase family)
LGFCAAVTERVQLGSGIAIAFTRSPFETAMTAMDLDRVSGGRVVLGLGTSIKAWVEDLFGVPGYGKPVEHLRETIGLIREIIAKSHTGELERFQGTYHAHDWTTFQGAFAPPVRERIPIWVAANQRGLTRLAGELCEGFIDHPAHGPHWALTQGQQALEEGLRRAGRDRSDIHWNAWFWAAVSDDRREAIEDSRPTMAFYAGMKQYEPMYAALGFEREARACQAAVERRDMAAAAAAVTDEMVDAFVLVGSPDECRKRLAEVWDVADSFCLVPPLTGLSPEKFGFYLQGIAETFYS